MNAPISDDDLHAYADGQLDATHVTRIEAWLAVHPEHRRQVEQWRTQSTQLHRAYDHMLDEAIPARLNLPPPAAWIDARKAAMAACLMVGIVTGFFLRDATRNETPPPIAAASLPRMAAVAHAVYVPQVRHPVEVGIDQEAHLVAWLSKCLGAPLHPPQLEAAGFQLIGGRLLPGEREGVAQFMYENTTHQRLTLYLRRDAGKSGGSGFRYAREDNIDVFYWIDGTFGYALSGDIGRTQMLTIAQLVYQQSRGT